MLASQPYFQDGDEQCSWKSHLSVSQVPADTGRKGNVQKLQGRQEPAPEC